MAKSGWKRAAYAGLPAAALVSIIVIGIWFDWFDDPDGGAWSWIEAGSWIVAIGVGIPSLVVLIRDRQKTTRSPARPLRDPSLLDRGEEFDCLRTRLSEGPWGIVTVVGVAGIGKSKLVNTVVAGLKRETPHPDVFEHTVAPDIRFDVRLLIANIQGRDSLPAVLGEDEPLLGGLAAALASAGQKRIVIIIESAQHLPRRGDEGHLDIQLDEALHAIDTDRRHRVSVVLVSNVLLKSKTGSRNWLAPDESIGLGWLPREYFDLHLRRVGLAELREKRSTLREQLQGNPGCVELMGARFRLAARELGIDELMAPLGATVTVKELHAVTIDELSPAHQKVVHALAACATPVSDTTVTALLTGYAETAEIPRALADLVDNQLVRVTADKQYYLPVDDVKALLPKASDKRSDLLRMAADELAKQRVADPTEPGQLRMHFAQIRALLTAERYAVAYDVVDDIIDLLKEWNCRFLLFAQREEMRNKLGNQFREMANDSELGFLYGEQGDFEKAHEAYGSALTYANQWGDVRLRTSIRANFAAMYWQENNAEMAYNYYEQARSEAQSHGEPDTLMQALLGLADCHRRWAQYDKAIGRAKEILATAEQADAARMVKVCLRLARWHTETGDLPEAKARLSEAQQIAKASRDPRLALLCLDAEADVYLSENQYPKAKARVTAAVERALALQDPVVILQARTTLCMIYLRIGQVDEAAPHIEDAMRYRQNGRALIVLALHALITQATDPDSAPQLFDDLAKHARHRIANDKQDFGAYEMLGFAICGQLLDTDDKLDAAITAFGKCQKITQGAEPLLAERRRFLVSRLNDTQTTDRLAPVIQFLSGARAQPPE